MRFGPLTADIADAVHNVIDLHELLRRAEFNDVDATGAQHIIESGAAFVRDKIAPVAAALDSEGCRLVDGSVRLPDSFAPIWRGYADDGWLGLSVAQDSGGGDAAPRPKNDGCAIT
jgi:alkylation response protein AidB-like acyl-CoA dehydrogenase